MRQTLISTTKRVKADTNAALDSSAQTNTLCAPGESKSCLDESLVLGLLADSSVPTSLRAIIELMFESGCRVSQAINVTHFNISKNGRICLQGSKGSNDVYYSSVRFKGYWLGYKTAKLLCNSDYNRFFIYRFLKQRGIFYKSEQSQKYSVCHAFRHNLATDIAHLSSDENFTSRVLGHKNSKSTQFYLHNEKKSSRNSKYSK